MCGVRWLIAVFTLCLVLAGCSKGGGGTNSSKLPTAILPASTSASASPSRTGPLTTGANVKPGETPPVAPSEVHRSDYVGAENFAVYYFLALDWSFATTDPYLLKDASSKDCAPCQQFISAIGDLAAAGGHFEGARVLVNGYTLTTGTLTPADFVIKVDLSQTAGTVVRPGQAPSLAASSTPQSADFLYLKWVGSGWNVVDIGLAQ